MKRTAKKLISLIFFFIIVTCSFATADILWTDNGPTHLWVDANNWSNSLVPDSSTDVRIVGIIPPNEGPLVVSGDSVQCNAYKLRDGTMTMTGGSLNVYYWGGAGSWGGVNAELNMSGNASVAVSGKFYIGYAQQGKLVMSDNAEVSSGGLIIGKTDGDSNGIGHFQLNGGQYTTTYLTVNNNGLTTFGTIDITGGTLLIDGNEVETVSQYISDGFITAYGGQPRAVVEVEYTGGDTFLTASLPNLAIAWNPSPSDTKRNVNSYPKLSWNSGNWANAHDVYIGTVFEDVNDANENTIGIYKGKQYTNSYDLESLELGQTYYWRIDEVNDSNNDTWKGDIWSFTADVTPTSDFSGDLMVDFYDFSGLADFWKMATDPNSPNDIFDVSDNNNIDESDLDILAKDWLVKSTIDVSVDVNSYDIITDVCELLLGMNMSRHRDTDDRWLDGTIANHMKDVNTAILRWPGGSEIDTYHWSECPGAPKWKDSWETNPASEFYFADHNLCHSDTAPMDINEFLYWCYDFIGAEAMLGVNFESGWRYNRLEDSLDETLALMQHCKNLGYNVKYWYFGNEVDTAGVSALEYAEIIEDFAIAMKQVDPNIYFVANDSGLLGENWVKDRWNTIVDNSGGYTNFADVHWYWARRTATWSKWQNQNPMLNVFHSYTGPTYIEEANLWYNGPDYGFGADVKLCVNEWSVGIPADETWQEDTLSGYQCALVNSEMFMQFMQSDIFMACLYPSSFSVLLNRNPDRGLIYWDTLEPTPTYHALKLFSDSLGNKLIKSESTVSNIPSVAVLKEDGKQLWVYLLNKSSQEKTVRINFSKSNIKNLQAVSLTAKSDNIFARHSELIERTVGYRDSAGFTVLPSFSLTRITVDF